MIAGTRAVAGQASFSVTKSGAAGSSNIRQGHHFAVAAGRQAVVGQVRMGLEAGARLSADLLVKSDDGLECRATAPVER